MYLIIHPGEANTLQYSHSPHISRTSPTRVAAHPNLSDPGEAHHIRMNNSNTSNVADEIKHIGSSPQVTILHYTYLKTA